MNLGLSVVVEYHEGVALGSSRLVRQGAAQVLACGYEDGNFSVVAGHLEDEPAKAAARREGKEEANIDIEDDDLEFVHLMHRRKPNGEIKLDFFFRCTRWSGTIENVEPHKCDLMTWRAEDDLPPDTIPYVRAALDNVRAGHMFSEYGWSGDTAALTG